MDKIEVGAALFIVVFMSSKKDKKKKKNMEMCSESSVMSSVMSPHVNQVNKLTTFTNFGSDSVFLFISECF